MLAFGDGGMREREVVVAAGAIRQSVAQAREEVDSTLDIEYRIEDAASRIGINRWEVSEVMGQLVENAVEAMGAGGPIRVSIEDTEIGEDEARLQGVCVGAHVRVRVEDEGPGIAVALRSHVFEPFFTTKGAGDGKGLGLAIAYSLVRGWNGNLSVGSRGKPRRRASRSLFPRRDRRTQQMVAMTRVLTAGPWVLVLQGPTVSGQRRPSLLIGGSV